MAIIKCKMCGGELVMAEDSATGKCEYCGTVQTVPQADDEKKLIQFERAERLRKQCEFDKAAGLYESIVADFRQEAEAYWGLVLCKYGIEYVDDPATGKKIPTCHRSSFDSIMDDSDFEQVMENADSVARKVYREEAKAIEEIRKGIIAVSSNEEPYDIFICYKETADDGQRTLDSVLAQDVYDALTDKGYRVFFSRITLEDKLGVEYEPYIFAALNSAKVMLAFGTDYDYYNAVWVKNEWSRFLKLMAKDKEKHLIPCYKGIDAYDIPKEFAKLQAQDMGKVGALQDLLRGIQKLLSPAVQETATIPQPAQNTVAPLLKRAFMFLEDAKWQDANAYCEKVLDIDPENALAYLGKLMAERQLRTRKSVGEQALPFDNSDNYRKALRFGDEALKQELIQANEQAKIRQENNRLEGLYVNAARAMANAKNEQEFHRAGSMFAQIRNYKDAAAQEKACEEGAKGVKKDLLLASARSDMEINHIWSYERAMHKLETIPGWKNADALYALCQKNIALLKEKEEADRKEAKRLAEIKAKRKKKILIISAAALLLVIIFLVLLFALIIPSVRYKHATELEEQGKLGEAAIAYENAGNFKDAEDRSKALWEQVTLRDTISTREYHTVGLKTDGTVVAVGNNLYTQCDISDWTDIVAISAGYYHTVGLKADGTVVAVGDNEDGQCDVSEWTDVVAISAGGSHTVGLKADGTVVAVGSNSSGQCDVSEWTDVVAISAGGSHTVGLKADGTVVAIGYNDYGQCNVSGWTDIVAISAGNTHTVGLKADGTVVAVGNNNSRQCDIGKWTGIVAIQTGIYRTVGLKADGTAISTVGSNLYGECNISEWTNIVAISVGEDHTVGLKANGTVVAVGRDLYNQCDVDGWTDIKKP